MPLDSSSSSVLSQVEHDLKNKKYTSALQKLSSVSNQMSKNIDYLYSLAKVLKAQSDIGPLIKTLRQITKQSDSVAVEIELMQLLYKNGQINEALDVGLAVQEKKLTQAQKMTLVHLLMKIYIEENDFDGVQEVLEQSATQLPQSDFMHWAQGLVYVSQNEPNHALISFRLAIELNAKNDQAWVSLALLHHEMGDEELALANLETSLDCNPYNNAAVKLYSLWTQKKLDKTLRALNSVQFYLSEHDFDEEISLCHVQLLCRLQHWTAADTEVEKLILTYPKNLNYREMKKNLEQNLNM
jgi:tetratricopeptide (TPR) repeat protein